MDFSDPVDFPLFFFWFWMYMYFLFSFVCYRISIACWSVLLLCIVFLSNWFLRFQILSLIMLSISPVWEVHVMLSYLVHFLHSFIFCNILVLIDIYQPCLSGINIQSNIYIFLEKEIYKSECNYFVSAISAWRKCGKSYTCAQLIRIVWTMWSNTGKPCYWSTFPFPVPLLRNCRKPPGLLQSQQNRLFSEMLQCLQICW